MKKRFWVPVLLIAAVAVGAFFMIQETTGGASQQVTAKTETGVTVGKAAPVFTLNSLEGNPVEVGHLKKAYVINFWATWCPPCRAELPELNQFAKKYETQVGFYAVNIQEPQEKVAAFLQQNGYNLPVLFDVNGEVARAYRVTAIPTTLVMNAQGIIVFRKTGGVTLSELEETLKELQVQ